MLMILRVGFWSSDSKVLKVFKQEAKQLAQNLFTQKVRCVKMNMYRKLPFYRLNFYRHFE